MTEAAYNNTFNNHLHPAYVEVTSQNMQEATEDVRKGILEEYDPNEVCDTAVSCD